MKTIIGPVLVQHGAYCFSTWTPERGLSQSYPYQRIDDAYYARKVALSGEPGAEDREPVACATLDAFRAAIAALSVTDGVERRRPMPAESPIPAKSPIRSKIPTHMMPTQSMVPVQNKNRRPLARPAVFRDELAPAGL